MTIFLNEMLGTTLAAVQGGKVSFAKLSVYGQRLPALPTAIPKFLIVSVTASEIPERQTIQPNTKKTT